MILLFCEIKLLSVKTNSDLINLVNPDKHADLYKKRKVESIMKICFTQNNKLILNLSATQNQVWAEALNGFGLSGYTSDKKYTI